MIDIDIVAITPPCQCNPGVGGISSFLKIRQIHLKYNENKGILDMIQVPEEVVRELLLVIDEVGWHLFQRSEHDDNDEVREYYSSLLKRLTDAKKEFENKAKSQDGMILNCKDWIGDFQ